MLKFNPFQEYGITDYKQFKKFPFLQSKSILRIKNKIKSQIRDKFMFPERLLILGEPGIGKTSTLFFIEDLLNETGKCNVFFFSKFFTDAEDFERETNEILREITKNPTYFLIDFPDTINTNNFKKFLDFLWSLITHKNYENINLIFALNISHFNKSFNFSEILGKFDRFRLERMEEKESDELIKSRLKMANSDNYFESEVYKIIYRYSKGIPRNIICASKNLVENFFDEPIVKEKKANELLKEEYIEQIINDRVEDINKRLIYKKVVEIIDKEFGGEVQIQNNLIKILKEKLGIGRNKSMTIISDLCKFGIVNLFRGGKNNTNKIISLK